LYSAESEGQKQKLCDKIFMKKVYLLFSFLTMMTALSSCYDNPADVPVENRPPETHVFIFSDSTISQQQSSLRLYWWADDPDGLIAGYYISMDNINWQFTTSNDSLIAFPIEGTDTLYIFRVAAVDDYGNGIYDAELKRNGIDLGGEPYADLNNNGKYDSGEPFIDIGAMDPEPAELKLPLKNSPPVLKFLADKNNATIMIPEFTFTVASFGWTASDIDGDATIKNIYVALNDTAGKIAIPGSTRFITIKAVPPFASDVVDADVYLGSSIGTPYSIKLPGLKLNADNIIYLYGTDIAGASSSIIQMPPAEGDIKWYVKKPAGEILVVDDNSVNDNSAAFYASVFDTLGLSSKIDVWNIDIGKTASVQGKLMPDYISPQFTETLKLFKYVFWYTDNIPSLEPAQVSITNYINSGGRVLFSMIFPQIFDARGLSDFLPIDSLSPAPISIIPRDTKINPTDEAVTAGYPFLSIDDSPSPVARIRTYYPGLSAISLYNLEYGSNPVIGFKTTDSKLIFLGIPLHRSNGAPHKVTEFFRNVFYDEFGVN
jgi:hypothetical protein